MDELKPGQYRHYKGGLYQVIGLAQHSETEEEFVVYRALYGMQELWIRSKVMFLETVLDNGIEVRRFTFIEVSGC